MKDQSNPPDEDEKWLSYRDLSVRWKIPVQTLRAWVMRGKLKTVKLGRHVRFSLTYITSLEEAGGLA